MFSFSRTALLTAGLFLSAAALFAGCTPSLSHKDPLVPNIPVAAEFVYPVGRGSSVTQGRDSNDGWYNAQDAGVNDHLGEDWNGNSGGNSDCGEPVRAAADGKVAYAGDAGPGWGNVIIVDHRLPDGSDVQSLYGHLLSLDVNLGEVRMGQKLGTIGDGSGKYQCHLHFEIRLPSASAWGSPGPGYSRERDGWLDPSDFIDARLAVTLR